MRPEYASGILENTWLEKLRLGIQKTLLETEKVEAG
jgi:hypothetical protein